MKVAVSIPDDLHAEIEGIIERRGCSRSALYADALRRLADDERQPGQWLRDILARPTQSTGWLEERATDAALELEIEAAKSELWA